MGSDKIDPITKCAHDIMDAIKIVEKTCKYIFKFLLWLKIKDRGIKKIKEKISWIRELFKPIKNKKI